MTKHPPPFGFLALVALVVALLAAAPAGAQAPGTPTPAQSPTATPAPRGTSATAPSAPGTLGGYPYDASRDRGCPDCGPNGSRELYGDRVRRWAGDCGQSAIPSCQTPEGALRDSVERLYSEFQKDRKDWAESGFLAVPDIAGSRHNCPDYWAGQAKGCVADGSAGGAGGGGSAGGGYGVPNPSSLARSILGALDFKALLTGLIKAIWEVLVGDGIEQIGGDIAALLLATPDLRVDAGSMGNVQRLVDALRGAAVGACLVAFTVTVVGFMLGNEQAPGAALGRLGAVLFVLGFYRPLVGWLVQGSNVIAGGILSIGGDQTTPAFTGTLKALVPAALPLWYLLSLLGAIFLIAVGVVKILGFAFLLITYVAGPILLPLGIHPRTAPWVGKWAEHLVKALLWPALWALEFRVFGALAGGISLLDAGGRITALSLAAGPLGALTALATLIIMAYTPWTLHTKVTLAGGAQVVSQKVTQAANAAVTVASGGTSRTVQVALGRALASGQRAAQAQRDRRSGA